MVFDVFKALNPDVSTGVWNDSFLKRYVTQLVKRQWGQNLVKYEGMQMPGGVQFQGRAILEDANTEILRLQEEMISAYTLPVHDMIG